MSVLRLAFPQLSDYPLDTLRHALANAGGDIFLEMPASGARELVDIAQSYLETLFVGETVAVFCADITAAEQGGQVYFQLRPHDVDGLACQLLWLAAGFARDGSSDSPEVDEVYSALEDFAEELRRRPLRFPELADDYWANYLASARSWLDEDEGGDDSEDAEIWQLPEHRHGFWRSFASQNFGYDFYVSPRVWILPPGVDAIGLLANYKQFDGETANFQEAEYYAPADFPAVVFSGRVAATYPAVALAAARECKQAIWPNLAESTSIPAPLAGSLPAKLLLAEDAALLIVAEADAQYIVFNDLLLGEFSETAARYVARLPPSPERLQPLPYAEVAPYLARITTPSRILAALRAFHAAT